jgi:hypothetical protein
MTRRSLAALSTCFLLLLAVTATAADAGKAAGTLTINGKTAKMAYSYARLAPDPFDKKSTVVVLTVSEKPLKPEDVADDFGLMNLGHKINALVFTIDKDKQVISGEIHHEAIDTGSFSATGVHEFEPTVFTKTHVTGKMYMKKAEKFFDTTYQYSVTFDVAVAPKK